MGKKLFVWDLHGTLECGNELAVIKLSNEVLSYRGYAERFREDEAIRLYGQKWYEYFRYLLPNEEQHVWFSLQEDCFLLSETELDIQASYMSPTPESHDVLKAISVSHRQILISNTRPGTLRVFMDKLGLDQFFCEGEYFAVDGHTDHRKTKVEVLNDYLQGKRFKEIVVIGDSRTDMSLGSAVGAYRILYNHPYLKRKDIDADTYTSDLRDVLTRIDDSSDAGAKALRGN